MFIFDLQKSPIALAILSKNYFLVISFLRKTFFTFFVLFSLAIIWGFLISPFSEKTFSKIFGLVLLSLSLFISTGLLEVFYHLRLKKPKPKISLKIAANDPYHQNLANLLDFEAGEIFFQLANLVKKKKIPFDSTLLLSLLLETQTADFIFIRLGLSKKEFQLKLQDYLTNYFPKLDLEVPLFTKEFQKTIIKAIKLGAKKDKELYGVGDLLSALSEENIFFKKFLIEKEIKTDDLEKLANLKDRLELEKEKRSRFWSKENLAILGSIGRDLASGYTITLDQYSKDLTKLSLIGVFQKLVGHEQELKELERILTRSVLNNVLLVGRPGSGKRRIVEYFARESYFGRLSSPLLNYKKVIILDLPSLVAQIETLEKAEEVLERIFKEVEKAGNVILIIEEFHNFVSKEPKPGVLNISGLLSSFLEKPEFQLIALTTYIGLHEEIEKNPFLLKYFNKIEVRELTEEETLEVLEDWIFYFEKRYHKIITLPALRHIVSLAGRYLPDTAFPKKAIDLLDEVMVYSSNLPDHPFVLPEDVEKVITEKTEIPVGKIEEKEKEILLNLEKLLHQRIVNQEEAVEEIAKALRRARTEITIRKGPMGSFLFLGPTGVGKTETSKALAEIYFGSEKRMIRLDMSEFQETKDIARLLGGFEIEGLLTTPVRENPFSLVLLDEFEKAHPNILNLFLQVFDEGYLKDGLGRKVNFQNTIIIATSNAGAQIIWEDVKEDKKLDLIKEDLFTFIFKKNLFRPELINRFDGVIVFKPLSHHHLLEIAELMLSKLKENLKEKEIELLISPLVKEKIVQLGYNPAFGAREMRRVIQDKIENMLAIALLENKIKRGDKIKIVLKEKDQFSLEIVESKLDLLV